jgi:ribosome recycling factor
MSILETTMDCVLEMQKAKDVPEVKVDLSKLTEEQRKSLEKRIENQTVKEVHKARRKAK